MSKQVKEELELPESVMQTSADFRLEQLFGSTTRVRLLRLLLEHTDRSFYVRELTRRIDAQLNSVRRELQNLIDIGIILEVEGTILPNEKKDGSGKSADKKKYYKANTDFAFFEELRGIMKKSSVLMHKQLVQDLKAHGRLDLLLLTGQFIDAKNVPTDVLVVGTLDTKKLQKDIETFEAQIGHEVNYTYMPREEFVYRKEVKDRFLSSILQAEHVLLVNEIDEKI
ncbi:MAG: hypothetical protein WCT24_03205 [Patescibacteria group bacterium]|jgi:hypothetical protein